MAINKSTRHNIDGRDYEMRRLELPWKEMLDNIS